MKKRKACEACGKPLLAFKGMFLHPEAPCAGLKDCVAIEAHIEDEQANELFTNQYGKPELDDYQLLARYEERMTEMDRKFHDELNKATNIFTERMEEMTTLSKEKEGILDKLRSRRWLWKALNKMLRLEDRTAG